MKIILCRTVIQAPIPQGALSQGRSFYRPKGRRFRHLIDEAFRRSTPPITEACASFEKMLDAKRHDQGAIPAPDAAGIGAASSR